MTASDDRPFVDVTQVTERRELHFAQLSDILDEARRLVARENAVRPLGNLTLSQALGHVAATVNASFDGFSFSVPPEVATYARAHLQEILAGPMRAGNKLPSSAQEQFFPPADLNATAALAALETALARFEIDSPSMPHPFVGELTPEQWVQLHCRHSELHLGFMQVDA